MGHCWTIFRLITPILPSGYGLSPSLACSILGIMVCMIVLVVISKPDSGGIYNVVNVVKVGILCFIRYHTTARTESSIPRQGFVLGTQYCIST